MSFFEPATRRETLTLSLEKIGAQVPLEARLAWLDGNELLTGAMAKCRYDFMADAPALVAASQLTKEARVWKTLPEWTGRCIRDVAVTGDGQVLIVVSGKLLTTTEERSELYVWDVSLDAVRRLTGFNHVLGVSNTGR